MVHLGSSHLCLYSSTHVLSPHLLFSSRFFLRAAPLPCPIRSLSNLLQGVLVLHAF